MARKPERGHEALRRGRWSQPEAEYFLTFCTKDRKTGLTEPKIMSGVLALAHNLQIEGVWFLRSAVVMPDHVHLLIGLRAPAKLTEAVRLFKGRLTPLLRQAGVSWQQAFFDHCLRSSEDRLPVCLYIFLNPYRAGLLPRDKKWPGYYCCEEYWVWFGELTESDTPIPEWLA